MKRSALALVVLLALAIAWRVWSSKSADAPSIAAQAPAAPTATQLAKEAVVPSAPDAARAEVRMEVAPQTSAASPTSPPLESAEILVRGTVRDEKGQPVASEFLNWIDDTGTRLSADVESGSYSMPGLLAGHYLVTAGRSALSENQIDVTLSPTPAVQQHDFTIHLRTEIAIRIVSEDGQPLIGKATDGTILPGNTLIVSASRSPPAGRLDPALLLWHGDSDCSLFGTRWDYGNSRPEMGPDCLGILVLNEPPPLYVSLSAGNAVLATQRIEEVPKELVFRLRAETLTSKRAGLRLRLLDSDGKTPITHGGVDLEAERPFIGPADADGRVEMHDLPPGGYDLYIEAAGHMNRPKRSIVLEEGQVLDLGDVVFVNRPRQSVRFQFHGDVQPSVQFVVKREYAGEPSRTLGPIDNSMNSTLFKNPVEIALPEAGPYELRVISVGEPASNKSTHLGARPVRVVFTDEPSSEIVVQVQATTETCLKPPRESPRISHWIVSTPDGLPCQRVRIEGRAPTRIELVPGEYTIARIDPETKALGKSQAFTVGSNFSAVDLQP